MPTWGPNITTPTQTQDPNSCGSSQACYALLASSPSSQAAQDYLGAAAVYQWPIISLNFNHPSEYIVVSHYNCDLYFSGDQEVLTSYPCLLTFGYPLLYYACCGFLFLFLCIGVDSL